MICHFDQSILISWQWLVYSDYRFYCRYHCSRFGYHWSMEDTKTTYRNLKGIFNDSSCSWWPVIKKSLHKRYMLGWVRFHQVVFRTKCVISNENIWKHPFGLWNLRRLWYVEETITQVTVCIDTAITLPKSIPDVCQGKFILCVTKCDEYNTESFFVVKIKRRRIWWNLNNNMLSVNCL